MLKSQIQPTKIAISAMGGQGGGVLADWIRDLATSQGYVAQSTSVPGVAQRTGATIYYLEIFPETEVERVGRQPVLGMTPIPGDVDILIAAELVEAGRAVQRGFVTPDKTTLIATTHRAYTVAEKQQLGNGLADGAKILEAVRQAAKSCVAFDMEQLARENSSVISSVLFGALAGTGALPFARDGFEAAIRAGGIAVATNLAAFDAAYRRAQQNLPDPTPAPDDELVVPAKAATAAGQRLLERVRKNFPENCQGLICEGIRQLVDYQDFDYAQLYLDRLERVFAKENPAAPPAATDATTSENAVTKSAIANSKTKESAAAENTVANDSSQNRDHPNRGPSGNHLLTRAVARHLALWMAFQDTIRVADQKVRRERFERIRREVKAEAGQFVYPVEYLHPRLEEVCDSLPRRLGAFILDSPRLRRRLSGLFAKGRRVHTGKLGGYLLLYTLSCLRRLRRFTYRYSVENAAIEAWLERIVTTAADNYALALRLAEAQRLLKGYGDTHARGLTRFNAIMQLVERSGGRVAASTVEALCQAALASEDGSEFDAALAAAAGSDKAATSGGAVPLVSH
ncbi:indolepyruvate oxidoreductase subunit beta family protein [Exilibacterium tricleocarpae]|uniref:Indolepyruvate oxidoreductase subunit beta family protein n=1 Tax=Exilibacterium tricleocarpae TaxID=2591008 RepID=A0A545ST34_9GAMM|nr:indolepyruvate oxidoreductase subunit beta family protein [Exilibacterium tricleocarpae]TQV68124.1 indolepyruvate oxidoreductase subunit beta family protein [Exilibacterium tricleocarpae]